MTLHPTGLILIVDDNPIVRERLVETLRAAGEQVVAAATGECAFGILRNWSRPVDWLYTRADLPGLIDGWILADAYRELHPTRAAVISVERDRVSLQGDVVVKDRSPTGVLRALRTCRAKDLQRVPMEQFEAA